MSRVALQVAYDGTSFSGFQRQADCGGRTVQGVLEEVLGRLCGRAPSALGLKAAGRTDAGVHASAQVVAFDTDRSWDALRWRRALNALLPDDTAVLAVAFPSEDFDPRRMAVSRAYSYRLLVAETADPLRRHVTWHLPDVSDLGALERAWAGLVGHHDFSAFCSTGSTPRSPWVTVQGTSVDVRGDEVVLRIQAASFLYHMVRRLVGAVRLVASGRGSVEDYLALLDRDRKGLPPPVTAPARGLCLDSVVYPQGLVSWDPPISPCKGPSMPAPRPARRESPESGEPERNVHEDPCRHDRRA